MSEAVITLWVFRNHSNAKEATVHTHRVWKCVWSGSCCSIKCLVMFQCIRWLFYISKAQTMTDPQSHPKTFIECCWSPVDTEADCTHSLIHGVVVFHSVPCIWMWFSSPPCSWFLMINNPDSVTSSEDKCMKSEPMEEELGCSRWLNSSTGNGFKLNLPPP